MNRQDVKVEKGLHYHLGLRYEGEYHNGKTNGMWIITKNGDLVSTCELLDDIPCGMMEIFNQEGDLIFRKGCNTDENKNDVYDGKELKKLLLNYYLCDVEELWRFEDES